jgi:hypothetical protein
MPGHDSGHEPSPPVGFSWDSYMLAFVEEYGGFTALSDELSRRAAKSPDFPSDVQVAEKGLRRLAKRGGKGGGQYGRWMLRHLGVPASLERWAQWMGQFHSRFADLPTSLRFQQLSLWDRPPLSESRIAAWIHVGLASVLLRMQRRDEALARLAMAERAAQRAGVACQIEVALVRAKELTDDGDRPAACALFDRLESWLGDAKLSEEDRRCYHARLVGQRAYHLTRPADDGAAQDIAGALALFESIADEPFNPFVAFRKCNGLAYCRWKLGDVAAGRHYASLAEQHAGDGGFVRFRVMALNLASRMLPGTQGAELRARALRLAALVEDEDLQRRVTRVWISPQ